MFTLKIHSAAPWTLSLEAAVPPPPPPTSIARALHLVDVFTHTTVQYVFGCKITAHKQTRARIILLYFSLHKFSIQGTNLNSSW